MKIYLQKKNMKGRTITGVVLMAGTLLYLMVSVSVLRQDGMLKLVNEMKETLIGYREEEGLKLQVPGREFHLFWEENFHNSSLAEVCDFITEKFLTISSEEEIKDKDFRYYIMERKKEREFIKKYPVSGRIGYTK